MGTKRASVLAVVVVVVITVVVAGCSTSGSPAKGTPTSTSGPGLTVPTTTGGDPNLTPNPIPFNVGEIAARSNDWRMGVTKVTRPLAGTALSVPPAGQEYVGVDFMLANDGTDPRTVNARALFQLIDEKGKRHRVVAGALGLTGLDGSYAPGATKEGRLVFAAPVGQDLLLGLDGPLIGTQRTVFQVDPSTHPAQD